MLTIWISGVIIGISSRYFQSQIRNILSICSLVLWILLMSCNNSSIDEINMLASYGSGRIEFTSWLYYVIAEVCFRLGISFGMLNFITNGIACCLIAKALSKFTNLWGVCVGVFMFSAALLDVVLYKQFLASAFLIYGISFLLQKEKNKKKFVLFLLLACSFHLSMGIYAIFLLADIKALNRKSQNILYFLIACLCAIIYAITIIQDGEIPGMYWIARFIERNYEKNISNYILAGAMGLGWLYTFMIWFLSFLSLRFMQNMAMRNVIPVTEESSEIIRISYRLVVLSVCFMPLCMMNMSVFSRLYRPMIWIVLLCFAIVLEKLKKGILIPKVHFSVISYCIAFFVIYNNIISVWDNFSRKVLEGTLFFIN